MKTKVIYLFVTLVFIIVAFSKCTVQKRTYRNGYYVSWHKKVANTSAIVKNTEPKKKKEEIVFEPIVKKDNEMQALLLASVKKDEGILKKPTIRPIKILSDSCGDKIVLRNADEIDAKVIEINKLNVMYKRCDNLSGPMVITKADDIFMIKYANGTKEVFEKKTEKKPVEVKQPEKKVMCAAEYNNFAVASIATAILGLTIILAPIPFVLGIIGSNQIKKNPERYRGRELASIGIAFGSIGTILLLLIILFAI